jgi:hypothetical protein
MNKPLILIWTAIALAPVIGGKGMAQTAINFTNTGVASWRVGSNWLNPTNMAMFPPEGRFGERAFISNNGTAFVDAPVLATNTAGQTTNPRGPGDITIAAGTLEIRNGGILELAENSTSPFTVNRLVNVQSRLNIQGNGTLTAGQLLLQSTGIFNVAFTSATGVNSTPIKVQGTVSNPGAGGLAGRATLGGTLNLDFSAISPSGAYTLIDAGSVVGSFSSVTATGNLGANKGVIVTKTPGGNGTLVQASLVDTLSLTVNRDTGQITINNPHAAAIGMDAFKIQSAAGSLNGTRGVSLGSGWTPSAQNTTSNTVYSEFFFGNPPGTPNQDMIAPGAMRSISSSSPGLFAPNPPVFGQEAEDLVFQYSSPAGTLNATVNYTGTKKYNNIVLTIDPATGNANLKNTSNFAQEIEGYRITSADNSLLAGSWNKFQTQGIDNGTWQAGPGSPASLFEFQEDGTTLFDKFHVYDLGHIFNTGGSHAGVNFEFLLENGVAFTPGVVVFGSLPVADGLFGDYNGNHVVDAADYTVWRDHFGQTFGLPNRNPSNTGPIGAADYDFWKQHFGETDMAGGGGSLASGSNAVPEPSTIIFGLLSVGLVPITTRCRRFCHT